MDKEIESIIKSLPSKNSPGLDDFTTEVHETFAEELLLTLFKFF
jgi:hypothetical protein